MDGCEPRKGGHWFLFIMIFAPFSSFSLSFHADDLHPLSEYRNHRGGATGGAQVCPFCLPPPVSLMSHAVRRAAEDEEEVKAVCLVTDCLTQKLVHKETFKVQ